MTADAVRPVAPPGAASMRLLRVGTRRSALALAQSTWVADRLAAGDAETAELVHIRTEGDANAGPLVQIGGTGVFVTAVRDALLARRVDVIVHSAKDLPTAPSPGIRLAAVPAREDPADVLCARDGLGLAALPAGAVIGTGSPRRAAQLRLRRPDLQIVPIRGNVDTRLMLVRAGRVDGVVLARAGLARLGRLDAVTDAFDPAEMLPAPAQGALAVETRDGEAAWYDGALGGLDDPDARAEVTAERSLLAELQAGCSAPVGALGRCRDGVLRLAAAVSAVDGSSELRRESSGAAADAHALGRQLAAGLLRDGASALLGQR